MPVEERELVEALQAVDSATLEAIAAETGFGVRTLWRYRLVETPVPAARRRPLERALGLSSRTRADGDRDG